MRSTFFILALSLMMLLASPSYGQQKSSAPEIKNPKEVFLTLCKDKKPQAYLLFRRVPTEKGSLKRMDFSM